MASKYPGVTPTTDGSTNASPGRGSLSAAETVAGLVRPLNAMFEVMPAASTPGMLRTDSRMRLDKATTARLVLVPRRRRKDRRRRDTLGVEPGVHGQQIAKTGQQQTGADQKHDGARDLCDDEYALEQPCRSSSGSEPASFGESLIEVQSSHGRRRHQSDQHADESLRPRR